MKILRLAVFQNDSQVADKRAQLNSLTKAIKQASAQQAQLLLCPESFMTGYYLGDQVDELAEPVNGNFITQACKLAKENQMALVFGYPETACGKKYNSAIVIDKDGQVISNFRKLNLSGDFEKAHYLPGNEFIDFEVEGIKTSILICFDSEYPEAVRKLAQRGVELLLIPTALSLRFAIVAEKLIPTRSFENGIFIAYANCCGDDNGWEFSGKSCIVDPHGNDLARAGASEELIFANIDITEIEKARAAVPYLSEYKADLYHE